VPSVRRQRHRSRPVRRHWPEWHFILYWLCAIVAGVFLLISGFRDPTWHWDRTVAAPNGYCVWAGNPRPGHQHSVYLRCEVEWTVSGVQHTGNLDYDEDDPHQDPVLVSVRGNEVIRTSAARAHVVEAVLLGAALLVLAAFLAWRWWRRRSSNAATT
jgi:hypothetical protein